MQGCLLFRYTGIMKWIKDSQAVIAWHRLLDEVAQGEQVVFEHGGQSLVLRQLAGDSGSELPPKHRDVPSYDGLIQVKDLDQADQWRWEWNGPGEPLCPFVE